MTSHALRFLVVVVKIAPSVARSRESVKKSAEAPCRPIKVAEHSFLVPMRYLSLFSNHWQLGSQNWQDASSTKDNCILICFIGLGTVTMATQLVVNQH